VAILPPLFPGLRESKNGFRYPLRNKDLEKWGQTPFFHSTPAVPGRLRIVEASRTVSADSIDVSALERYLDAA
jgi:hypothetical protein